MINTLKLTYQLFDDTLMIGVDCAVRAYNWTTGGTKDELANGLLAVSSIVGSAGGIIDTRLPGYLLTIHFLLFPHFYQVNNTECAELERNALEKKALDIKAEQYKKDSKFVGPALGFLGFSHYPFCFGEDIIENTATAMIGAGFVLIGASFYIMRAKSPPPGKGVFSRMVDRYAELYRNPALRPIRITD